MSDYNDDAPHAQKGSVLPWLLLTVVIVFAGVGVVAMKSQADAAVSAVDKYKIELTEARHRNEEVESRLSQASKQLEDSETSRKQLDIDKAELSKKVDDLQGQLTVTKAEVGDRGGSKKGKKGAALASKPKRRR